MPHLLFYGPPGTGKTSTILALAHELFGPELYKSRVLELNASDERGIQVVREKVKNFARGTANQTAPGYPSPPYKIVILDEADSMTVDAQSALRRMMETYSKVTRFCLVCNYVSRIIEPLTSRCAKFRFKSLEKSEIVDRLSFVCSKEAIKVDSSCLEEIVRISGGDLRRAIMFLQSASCISKTFDIKTIQSISGVIPTDLIEMFLSVCKTGSFDEIEHFVTVKIVNQAYSGWQFLLQLNDSLLNSNLLSNVEKSMIAVKMGSIDKALVAGADEYLQLLDLGGFIYRQVKLKCPFNAIME